MPMLGLLLHLPCSCSAVWLVYAATPVTVQATKFAMPCQHPTTTTHHKSAFHTRPPGLQPSCVMFGNMSCPAGVAGATNGAATELGSSKNPIYMMQAEPTFRAQLWRTVRTLAVAFLLISGIGALFDERGLGRGILHNPDMKPQMESKTKFEDVKGVDEAKVCIRRLFDDLANLTRARV